MFNKWKVSNEWKENKPTIIDNSQLYIVSFESLIMQAIGFSKLT